MQSAFQPTGCPPRRQKQLTQGISFTLQQMSSSSHSHAQINPCQQLQCPPTTGAADPWGPGVLGLPSPLCQLLAPQSNRCATQGRWGKDTGDMEQMDPSHCPGMRMVAGWMV